MEKIEQQGAESVRANKLIRTEMATNHTCPEPDPPKALQATHSALNRRMADEVARLQILGINQAHLG